MGKGAAAFGDSPFVGLCERELLRNLECVERYGDRFEIERVFAVGFEVEAEVLFRSIALEAAVRCLDLKRDRLFRSDDDPRCLVYADVERVGVFASVGQDFVVEAVVLGGIDVDRFCFCAFENDRSREKRSGRKDQAERDDC